MRRIVAIGCGLAVAIAVALLALPTFAFAAALMQGNLTGVPQSVLEVIVWFAWADGSGRVLHQALAAAVAAAAIICVGPVAMAALVGEAAGLRTWAWYALATAALSVVLPIASGKGPLLALAQPVAVGPLAATGAVAGLIYWLIAVPSGRPTTPFRSATPFNLAEPSNSATENIDP